jgi:hypothetical protein
LGVPEAKSFLAHPPLFPRRMEQVKAVFAKLAGGGKKPKEHKGQ